jgi:hypothetical protein
MTGHQRLNSLHQLESVDLGTMTRCGPSIFRNSCRYATMEMLCRVLPVGWEDGNNHQRNGGRLNTSGETENNVGHRTKCRRVNTKDSNTQSAVNAQLVHYNCSGATTVAATGGRTETHLVSQDAVDAVVHQAHHPVQALQLILPVHTTATITM